MTQASFVTKAHNPDVLTCIANLSNDEVFTPPELANQILDSLEKVWAQSNSGENLWTNKNLTFLDPCAKSGVFLREIVCHPEFLTHPNRDEFLAYIGHNEVKRLFQWLVKIYFEIDEAEYVPIVQDELQAGGYSKEIKDIATDALFNYGNKYNEKVVQRMLKDYKVMLRMDQLRNKRRALVERQKTSHTQNEVDHLMVEISNLDKEISNLKNTVP